MTERRGTLTRGQIIFVVVVVLVNIVLWVIPSDIVELVARDRQTLLGRYSRRHFAWIIGVAIISLIAIWLHVSRDNQVKKRKAFKLGAVLLGVVPILLVTDIVLRLQKDWRYVLDGLAYHRPPNARWQDVFVDKPQAIRTYPDAPPGYGTVTCSLSIDSRGFRNPKAPDQCEVVVVGDSFVEGSKVSDEHVFPYVFQQMSGVCAYNLGASGYAPQHCRAALTEYGMELKPEYVVYLLYEANDFHSAKTSLKRPAQWQRFFKRSPIVEAFDNFLIRALGPIGADREVPALEVLSWMPIAYPPGPEARYYAFPPTFLTRHMMDEPEFASSKYWQRTQFNLEAIRDLCREHQARLIILFAPSKSHVVMPLVREDLPADKLRVFAGIKADEELAPAAEFKEKLFKNLDAKESVTRRWCEKNEVTFVSLTKPMRDAVRAGRQVYYTYDEHWSPDGHALVAEVLTERWPGIIGSATTQPGAEADAGTANP